MGKLIKDRTLPRTDCTREDVYDLVENLSPTVEFFDPDYLTVSGGKATLVGSVPRWLKVTLGHADLAAAATSNSVALQTLPAGAVVHAVKVKHSEAFAGGAISAYTISVGPSASPTQYINAHNVFQAVGDTVMDSDATVTFLTHAAAGTDLEVKADSTGANLNAATAGSVDIWVLWSTAA
jgi:hypothetical protein